MIEEAIKSKDKAKALKLFSNFQSQVMKASKKGSLKKTTVSRKVSRISKQISKL
jgi:ribosomal protein S20